MTSELDRMIAPGLAHGLLLEQFYLNVADFAIFTTDTRGVVTSWILAPN
ncbi:MULTISPECIES: hypothetical protein [unclassified Duganella]|nr:MULTISPECIES: hypothetical protein [unclassified Duganella]SDG36328.1 hypothetical protein SAMN05216320_10468 [Duganella sp. OV458]SDJ67113.1 hypothetical protein SAMN05428973_105336 [Duganella sp. OV510]